MRWTNGLSLVFSYLLSCQAGNYLTHDDCDADKDGDFAIGECGGHDCDDQDNRRSSVHGENCNDKIDNNCDGRVDEDCQCNTGEPARPCNTDKDGNSFTIKYPNNNPGDPGVACKSGQQQCINNSWGECIGAQGPAAESCDYKDNDCDGIIDNGFDTGMACSDGTGSCKRRGAIICNGLSASNCSVQADSPIDQYLTTPRNGDWDNNCDGKYDKICCDSYNDCKSCSGSCSGLNQSTCDSTTIFRANISSRSCGDMISGTVNWCSFSNGTCGLGMAFANTFTVGCK